MKIKYQNVISDNGEAPTSGRISKMALRYGGKLLAHNPTHMLPEGLLITARFDDEKRLDKFRINLKEMGAVLINGTVKNLEESLAA